MTANSVNHIENREIITGLCGNISREGMAPLLHWLDSTDFYRAPASCKHHLPVIGGLVQHSLNVYRLLCDKIEQLENHDVLSRLESAAIIGIFHDLAKVNRYIREKKNRKISGHWQEVEVWGMGDDQWPLGHGEKSVYLLQQHIRLTTEEAAAIRWHMGAFEVGVHLDYWTRDAFNTASKKFPLVAMIITADYEATKLLEMNAGVTE